MRIVFHIKNMVCPRCIEVVREELEGLGLEVVEVELGCATVESVHEVSDGAVSAVLARNGFELLHDKREELMENIKLAVIDLIYEDKLSLLNTNISTYLSEKLGKDYAAMSKVFKDAEDIALNKYIVVQKIERVKELLEYKEHTLGEIAHSLGYKSLQHLSAQFKDITGVAPLQYKKLGESNRKPINDII